MTKIKICGITNTADALAAIECGADMLGFVFTDQSPRQISLTSAIEIIKACPPAIVKVGLFVNQEEELVKDIVKKSQLDYLQFHGQEPPDYCRRVSKSGKIIKAFRVKDHDSLKILPDYDVEIYLLDSYREDKLGGTGHTFDWDLAISAKDYGRPIMLAGGLNPENVGQAVSRVRPYAVDVSSGIEKCPGKKDIKLMKEFIKEVRSYETA